MRKRIQGIKFGTDCTRFNHRVQDVKCSLKHFVRDGEDRIVEIGAQTILIVYSNSTGSLLWALKIVALAPIALTLDTKTNHKSSTNYSPVFNLFGRFSRYQLHQNNAKELKSLRKSPVSLTKSILNCKELRMHSFSCGTTTTADETSDYNLYRRVFL